MKSYTDLEQSKKLAEILPIESADMYYSSVPVREWKDKEDISKGTHVVFKSQIFAIENLRNHEIGEGDIYAWSLAALLSVLPIVYINNKKEVCGPLHIDITDSETPFVLWYVNTLHKGGIVELQTNEYDNLVDACVEMILKLHERKLL